jgi:protein gp37
MQKNLSCEPFVGPLSNMSLTGVDWVIAGDENGRKAGPIAEMWVWDIKMQCHEQGTQFVF